MNDKYGKLPAYVQPRSVEWPNPRAYPRKSRTGRAEVPLEYSALEIPGTIARLGPSLLFFFASYHTIQTQRIFIGMGPVPVVLATVLFLMGAYLLTIVVKDGFRTWKVTFDPIRKDVIVESGRLFRTSRAVFPAKACRLRVHTHSEFAYRGPNLDGFLFTLQTPENIHILEWQLSKPRTFKSIMSGSALSDPNGISLRERAWRLSKLTSVPHDASALV